MTPASAAPGVSVVGMIRAAMAAKSVASSAPRTKKAVASFSAVQAALVIAARAGAAKRRKVAPDIEPDACRKFRRDTLVIVMNSDCPIFMCQQS